MTPERWQAIDAAFEAARARTPLARAGFLAYLAGADPELRREVGDLLAAEERLGAADAFLAAPLPTPTPEPKPEVAGYAIGAELGRGGAGVVYHARPSRGGAREVALKVGFASLPRPLLQRFRREQEIVARLRHPGIAAFHELGATRDGRPYLAMELVQGRPLDRFCDEERLAVAARIALCRQLCSAVAAVHRLGVVHRDLKPGNVLVKAGGRVKLLDFGIAKALDANCFRTRLEQTDSRIHLLTPGYGSPEQCGRRGVTPASDVYSLAVMLFELLAGRKPFRLAGDGGANPLAELLQAVYERPPLGLGEALDLAGSDPAEAARLCRNRGARDLAELRAAIPGRLEKLLRRALAHAPQRRPPDAAAFERALGRCLAPGFFSRLLETIGRRNTQ